MNVEKSMRIRLLLPVFAKSILLLLLIGRVPSWGLEAHLPSSAPSEPSGSLIRADDGIAIIVAPRLVLITPAGAIVAYGKSIRTYWACVGRLLPYF